MPLLMIDPEKDAAVPGTQTYEARNAAQALEQVPRPSDSPDDPLNWPMARKNLILGVLCIHSILAAVLNPILATNTFQLVAAFHVSFTKIAMLTGFNVLSLAIAAIFFSATCRVYGRRHTFLLGSLLIVVGDFWAARAETYHSMLGARVLQGIGIAPFEGLVQVVVADLYFVSQRGRAYAFVAVSYLLGAMMTPILTGKLTVEFGRRAPFYLAGGFTVPCFLLVFFFFEETAFVRPVADGEGVTQVQYTHAGKTGETRAQDAEEGVVSVTSPTEQGTDVAATAAVISTFAMARLSPFSGRYSEDSLVKFLCRPVLILFHPAVFWGAVTGGTVSAWTVMLATDLAAIFAAESPAVLGYMYTAPLVAVIISLPLAGWTSDWLAKVLTRRFRVYEPEYRILLVLPFTVTALIGLFGFGPSIGAHHHIVPTVFFGFVVSAVVFGSVASATYVADAYQVLDIDCFIAFLLIKNLLAFTLTVRGFDWLVKVGTLRMMNTCGYIQIGICALSIPIFFFGKALRRYSASSAFWQYVFK